jgi:hypothetical protein
MANTNHKYKKGRLRVDHYDAERPVSVEKRPSLSK